jgi:hypothetical protein
VIVGRHSQGQGSPSSELCALRDKCSASHWKLQGILHL